MIFLYTVSNEMVDNHIIIDYVYHLVQPNVPPELIHLSTEVAI